MKKIFFLLMVFCSIKAISQDTLYIDINGRFYDLTINKKSTNFYIGGGNAYNDQVYIYANTKDTFTIYINCANCTWNLGAYKLKANLIYINGTKTTSITNLKNILGTIFTASNSGGGGGGSYTFAGNIVSQIGNDIIINQLQTDWNAISGLGSIANKPNIPILDSTQFVKLRDSNKNNNGFITPSFFFNNRGSGTKWSNFILGGYLVQKLNDSTYTINRDNTTIQDSIRINATIARFVGDSVKRDTSIANRVIDMSVDTNTNRLTIFKTNSNNKVLQFKINGGGGITNDTTKVAYTDSIGGITGKNTFVTPNYLQKYLTTGIKNNYLKYIEVIPFQPSGFFNTGIHLTTPTNIYKMYNNGNTYIRYLPAGIGSGAGAGYGKLVVDSPGTYFIFNAFRVETQIPPLTTVRYTIDHVINRFSTPSQSPSFYASYATFSYLINGAVGQEQQQQFLFQNYNKGDTIYTCFNSLTDVAIDQDTFSRFFLVKLTDLGANITNSGGGSGGTTDTTSLSNRINLKLDVQRFTADSISKQNSINFLKLNKIDSVTINGDTTLLTFYRNGTSSYNIQLKRASGGVVGISTKWNNLSISGYQVQKINDSTYNINRDNTIIQDSIRINGKLDVARFTGDSIRWDTAIANRIITQRIDTNLNRIYYQKTNGKIDSLQLRLTANAGGASINNDSIVHPYPYPYKDTVNIISTTDKVVNLGTNNKALINFNESIKVTQLFTTQTNVNGNARNGKFIRYGNTFQTFAGNVLLSSADGSTFTQLTTSQIMSANNQYTTIEAMDLSGDSLIVLTSAGGGNYILCILGSLGNTILYRSASFTISDGSGSFVTDISKIQLLGTSLYAVNGASFNNYLIKINIVNLTSQTIATTGSPAAFFKSTTNLYFLDYSGWYYEINAPTTRILKISNNAVSDATLLENRYICVSDYIGNIYVADMTINKVVDYINDVYFGSSDISVYAFGNILYVFDGTATTLYVTANQFSFNNLIVNTLAPFMFNSSLLDSAGSNGTNGQVLTSQNGKTLWSTPTQTYPLQSILIWGASASGAAQNPQLSFQSNNIGLALSGTGVTLPAGMYQITLVAGMPAIDNSAPYPISFFKFGLSSTIDASFSTYNEIRGCINKASSPAGNTDVLNATFSITLTVTTSTIYYVTTYINRGTSAAMSGFVNIVRIK